MVKGAAEVGATANSYQILGKLAVGGMAEIFLARGAGVTGVERHCVLKRILRELASDAQFVQMFIDEARLAAQLQHPNIASVYDIGMLGDSYFFTMEYVHGETVRSLLQRAQGGRRSLPLACVLTIIAGTAAGLHHAHERHGSDGRHLGIVHRDISPSNVMVSYEGNVKIVDFGVAKADDRASKTRSGIVKGKISYLSPEQCRGARVDRRSDLFSLGIVMWEMLTGARLYRRDSDFDNMAAIVHEAPPPPSSRRPEVPRAVDDIVMRLLAKSVSDRFQTAREVVEAIENASLRAGTILSMSAVSRLIREMFGARAEPWLELDGEPLRRRPITLGARPVAEQVSPGAADPAEAELAGVADSQRLQPAHRPRWTGHRVGEDAGARRLRGRGPSRILIAEHLEGLASRHGGRRTGPSGGPSAAIAPRRPGCSGGVGPGTGPGATAIGRAGRHRPRARSERRASVAPDDDRPRARPAPTTVGRARSHRPGRATAIGRSGRHRPGAHSRPTAVGRARSHRPGRATAIGRAGDDRSLGPPLAVAAGRGDLADGRRSRVTASRCAERHPEPAIQGRGGAVGARPRDPERRRRCATRCASRSSTRPCFRRVPRRQTVRCARRGLAAIAPPADRAALAPRNPRIARLGSPSLDDVTADRPAASAPSPAAPAARTEVAAAPPDARPVARPREVPHPRMSRTRRVALICAIGGALGGAAVWLSAATREEPDAGRPRPHLPRSAPAQRRATAPEATTPRTPAPAPPGAAGVGEAQATGEASAAAPHDTGDRGEIEAAAAPPAPGPGEASPAAPHRRARHSPDGAPPLPLPLPSPPMAAGPATAAPSSSTAPPATAGGAPAPPPPASEGPSPEALNSLFHLKEYAAILRACRATVMTADIAVVCILAACNLEATDQLTLWLLVVPEERRAAITARCDQLSRGEPAVARAPGRDEPEGSGGAERPEPP